MRARISTVSGKVPILPGIKLDAQAKNAYCVEFFVEVDTLEDLFQIITLAKNCVTISPFSPQKLKEGEEAVDFGISIEDDL